VRARGPVHPGGIEPCPREVRTLCASLPLLLLVFGPVMFRRACIIKLVFASMHIEDTAWFLTRMAKLLSTPAAAAHRRRIMHMAKIRESTPPDDDEKRTCVVIMADYGTRLDEALEPG